MKNNIKWIIIFLLVLFFNINAAADEKVFTQINSYTEQTPAYFKKDNIILNLQLEDFNMILSDFKRHKGLTIEGNISEVSAECVIIMRQIYKKNEELYGEEIATGILTNMLVKAIKEDTEREEVEWKVSEEEKLAYTD